MLCFSPVSHQCPSLEWEREGYFTSVSSHQIFISVLSEPNLEVGREDHLTGLWFFSLHSLNWGTCEANHPGTNSIVLYKNDKRVS